MPDPLAEARQELAIANRILANEGVLDAFGHISLRHPTNPDRYLISRYGAAELMKPDDILELTLDSKPVTPTSARLFSELVIHGCIYQARPDVHSVCHHHAVVGAALLHHRGRAGAGHASGRFARRQGAVLGQPRRVRRHAAGGHQARGGRVARARARAALDGAAAAPRRHPGGPLAARMRVPLDLYLPQCRAAEPRHGDRLHQHAQPGRGRDVQLTTA